MNITTLAVPALVIVVLTYLFQDIKSLLEHVPGIRPSDASHDDALRVVYGLLAFLAILVYQLYTGGLPVDANAWYTLLTQVGATAVTMAVTGHYLYQKVNSDGGSSSVSAPSISFTLPAASTAPAPGVSADPAFPPGVPLTTIQTQLAPGTAVQFTPVDTSTLATVPVTNPA